MIRFFEKVGKLQHLLHDKRNFERITSKVFKDTTATFNAYATLAALNFYASKHKLRNEI